MSIEPGVLYVVATPIGNLADISRRALEVLSSVALIAAEDTRQSGVLLRAYGISTRLISCHEHNESRRTPWLLGELERGLSIALVSDAGTPLVSDPGFGLVRAAREKGLGVVPIPGPCAAVCALSAAGLPADRFAFEGFPPRTPAARRECFEALKTEPRTLILYESSHRVLATVTDLAAVFGAERRAVVARELTKLHETFLQGTLAQIVGRMSADSRQCKGELVLAIAGAPAVEDALEQEAERVLRLLLEALPVKRAVTLAVRITGGKRNLLYRQALALQQDQDSTAG